MWRPDSIDLMMKKKSSMVKLPDTLDQHGGNDGRDDDMAADELGIEQLERERGKWGKGIRLLNQIRSKQLAVSNFIPQQWGI
ncbi:hypothetical protein TRIUR3_30695 [Triticum urartu]|uniref:Uncharacterized protein n=1 Tax=Triticum urartu TaxID=4572 RepID=M7ZCX9_TRIUA|nr:hypothetical protein TRIUR3_30695 [Triticum urartu]